MFEVEVEVLLTVGAAGGGIEGGVGEGSCFRTAGEGEGEGGGGGGAGVEGW